jgi:hypothetical protein
MYQQSIVTLQGEYFLTSPIQFLRIQQVEDLINKVSLNVSKCMYRHPSPPPVSPPVSPKAFTSKLKIGIIRKHKWTNSKFRNTIVNTNRWRASETFGVDRCLYSPLSDAQLARRETVGAALLRNMVDSLPELPALNNNRLTLDSGEKTDSKNSNGDGTEEKDNLIALLTTTKARSSVIYLDSPAPPAGNRPDGGDTRRGKSFVVRDSVVAMSDALAQLNDLAEFDDLDF